MGVSTWMRSVSNCTYTRRAPVGKLFSRVVGSQRDRNITLLVAVRKDVSVLHYQTFEPGVTRDDVAMFVTTLSYIIDDESAIPPGQRPLPSWPADSVTQTSSPGPPTLLKTPQSYRKLLFGAEDKRKTAISAHPDPMHTS